MALFGMQSFLPTAESGVWQHVQTQVLASPAASVSFTGLGGADFYMLTAFVVKDSSTNNPTMLVRLNNDSGTNYATSRWRSAEVDGRTGTAVASQTSWSTVSQLVANGTNVAEIVISKPAAAVRGQMWGSYKIDITPSGEQTLAAERVFGDWNNVAAVISRVDLLLSTDQMAAGTSVRLDQKDAA